MTINRIWKMGLSAAIFLMAFPAWVAAQVAITLTLPSAKALLYEDVIATVVVQNNSGQMLAQQPRLFAPGANFIDAKRCPRSQT